MKNQKGFTLTEIMVAIAIVGVLAGIAVPSYQRYSMQAKQAEAKANLTGLYQNMRSFFANYSAYTTRFDAIGYKPEGQLNYVLGFNNDFAPPLSAAGLTTNASCIITKTLGNALPVCSYNPTWVNLGPALNVAAFTGIATATATTFTAAALSKINNVSLDSWSMDSTGNLQSLSGSSGL